MTTNRKNRVCPVEHAGMLDFNLRKLVQNPETILKPYIKNGMSILDLGCGPGFFTIEIAKLTGKTGSVVAADLQQGMLDKVKDKALNSDYRNVISFYKCQKDKIGITGKFDLVILFYILHEVPDQNVYLQEIKSLLKDEGKILIVEPKFHVSKKDFQKSIKIIEENNLKIIESPGVFFSRSVLLKKNI